MPSKDLRDEIPAGRTETDEIPFGPANPNDKES